MEIVFQRIYHRFLKTKGNIFQQFSSRVKRSPIKKSRNRVHDSLRLVWESRRREQNNIILKEHFSERKTDGLVNG